MNLENLIPWLGPLGRVLLLLVGAAVGIAGLWCGALFIRFLGTRR